MALEETRSFINDERPGHNGFILGEKPPSTSIPRQQADSLTLPLTILDNAFF
jgi:hypothetical protein